MAETGKEKNKIKAIRPNSGEALLHIILMNNNEKAKEKKSVALKLQPGFRVHNPC